MTAGTCTSTRSAYSDYRLVRQKIKSLGHYFTLAGVKSHKVSSLVQVQVPCTSSSIVTRVNACLFAVRHRSPHFHTTRCNNSQAARTYSGGARKPISHALLVAILSFRHTLFTRGAIRPGGQKLCGGTGRSATFALAPSPGASWRLVTAPLPTSRCYSRETLAARA